MRWIVCITTFFTVAFIIVTSPLSVEFESQSSMATGGAARLHEPLASTSLNLPLSSDSSQFSFESGYNRAFGIKELDQLYLAGSGWFGRFNIALGISQLGKTDYYAERLLKTNLSYRWSSYNFSIALSHLSYHFGSGYSGTNVSTIGLGVGTKHKRTSIAISGDNLVSGSDEKSTSVQRQFNVNVDHGISDGYHLLFRGKFEQGQQPIFGIGQVIKLSTTGSLEYGVGTSPLRLGGGFRFRFRNTLISIAFSKHPVLGLSKVISISYILERPKVSMGKS